MKDQKTKPPPQIEEGEAALGKRPPTLEIDYALYEQMLEDSEWNQEQKREFIETLWSIVVQFVDLGFGIHPVQQAAGDVDLSKEIVPLVGSQVVESGLVNPRKTEPNHAVRPFAEAAERKEI